MTEWMLRRKGGRELGPVPTRPLIRGIKQGKVPPDTEAREVGGGEWMPLAAYDDFYEALGIDDAETRVVDTPWFATDDMANARDSLVDADEEEDEEATRVMDALSETMPAFGGAPIAVPVGPLPAAGRPAPPPLAAPPVEPRITEAESLPPEELDAVDDDDDMDTIKPPPAPPPTPGVPPPPPAPPPGAVNQAEPAPHPSASGIDPLAATMAASSAMASALPDAADEEDAVTAVIEPPSEQRPDLFDADEDAVSASAVHSGLRRAPLPAAGRPAPPAATGPAAPAANAAHGQPAGREVVQPHAPVRPVRKPGDFNYDRADEKTAPAARYQQQISRGRYLLLSISIMLLVVMGLLVLVLLQQR